MNKANNNDQALNIKIRLLKEQLSLHSSAEIRYMLNTLESELLTASEAIKIDRQFLRKYHGGIDRIF